MSVLVNLSTYFYSGCSHLAHGIKTAKYAAQYVAQVNYDIVATVVSFLRLVTEIILTVAEKVYDHFKGMIACVTDFFNTITSSVNSFISCFCKVVSGVCGCVVDLYTSVMDFINTSVTSVSDAVFAVKGSVLCFCECATATMSWCVTNCISLVMAVCMFFANIGQFCVKIVTGVWQGLGFVLASIAYFPVYCFECVESLKNKLIENVSHTFATLPKETYLGIICLCLLYFTLSNAVRYLSCHGVKLFSSRLRSRRRRPSFEWQLDREFESDFEDLYGNDTDDNTWMIPGTNDRNNGEQDDDANDDESDRSSNDSSDSDTLDEDDEVSDDDDDDEEGSEDGYTVISDDSDSDTSLNSQALSIESSDHEIEVNLPVVDERYSLRSRSSTPSSSLPNMCSSPEEFEREMEREKDKRKCVVCQDQVKSVLVMPCRHMCLCVLCADHLVRSRTFGRRVCPLCRTRIEKVMNVYV